MCRWPVDQIDALGGACEGCVEPAEVVGREHLLRDVALVYVDVAPLSALCLVAGDGVGILYLQCIVVDILLDALCPQAAVLEVPPVPKMSTFRP